MLWMQRRVVRRDTHGKEVRTFPHREIETGIPVLSATE